MAVAVLATALVAGLGAAALVGELPELSSPRRSGDAEEGRLARLLRDAGSSRRPVEVVAACVAAGLAVGALVVSITPIAALAVVPAVLVGAAPLVVLSRTATRRRRGVRAAWPDALVQVAGNLRAGRPLTHALIDLSLHGPPALREPLAGLAAGIQTVGPVPALQAVAGRVDDPVTDRVVEVLCLAHTEGGRIALDIVDDLAMAIADEVAAVEEAETLALEGTINARIVFALPWLVLVMLTARSGPFQAFYAGPRGGLVVGIGAVLSLVGVLAVSRLASVPEQPRVLAEVDR